MRTLHATSFDLDARIGIIGGGVAGLTAARALRRRGFRSVTVLEREERVGGQCSSFIHEGRAYEVGAYVFSQNYTNLRRLIGELGIKSARRMPPYPALFFDMDSRRTVRVPPVLRDTSLLRMGTGLLRLRAELMKRRDVHAPGLVAMLPDTFVPWMQWAHEAKIDAEVAQFLAELTFTSQGYGYATEASAAYVLKGLATSGVPAFFSTFDDGFQSIWEAIARDLDVRRGVTIQRVRRAERVVVETTGESFSFDAIIVTSPLDQALSFLDATEEERDLASKVRHMDVRVVVASATALPARRCIVLTPKHMKPSTQGELVTWYKHWADRDVGVFYAYGREGMSMDDTIARMADALRRAGSTLTNVYCTVKHRYFPHVSCQDLAGRFYERFEAMQGAHRTYYAGELLSFATVESVMEQALDLVDRHFNVARAPR